MDDRTFGEKVSDAVSGFGGSWKFIFLATFVFVLWIIFNTLTFFGAIAWDKYPFILLNLVLSFVAAFQAPFIMMSQKRCEAKQDHAYRMLFQEIKELVESDIDLENQIIHFARKQVEEIQAIRVVIYELKQHRHIVEEPPPP